MNTKVSKKTVETEGKDLLKYWLLGALMSKNRRTVFADIPCGKTS